MSTKEKLTQKALEMFNKQGIEYVGMRELAAVLDMRVGNVTYYFPTKDDLVMELVKGLRDLNTKTIAPQCPSVSDFIGMYKQVFNNQYQYRCLLLSFVHLVSQNSQLSADYPGTEQKRRETLSRHITSMKENGYLLASLNTNSIERIISHISLISRFWLSEARISYATLTLEQTIAHYLDLLCEVLFPYATEKGIKQIRDFRDPQ